MKIKNYLVVVIAQLSLSISAMNYLSVYGISPNDNNFTYQDIKVYVRNQCDVQERHFLDSQEGYIRSLVKEKQYYALAGAVQSLGLWYLYKASKLTKHDIAVVEIECQYLFAQLSDDTRLEYLKKLYDKNDLDNVYMLTGEHFKNIMRSKQ